MYDIYAIVNTTSGRAYIGVAPSFTARRREHVRRLDERWHSNATLQADWDALGEDAFRFVILGEAMKHERRAVEGAYIAAWKYETYNVYRNKKAIKRLPLSVEIDYSRVPGLP